MTDRHMTPSHIEQGTHAFTPLLPGVLATHELALPDDVSPAMIDYVSDTGVYNGSSYLDIVSEYDMVSDDSVPDSVTGSMEWTCGPDDIEEPEVSLPVSQFSELYRKAKAYDRGAVCEHGC